MGPCSAGGRTGIVVLDYAARKFTGSLFLPGSMNVFGTDPAVALDAVVTGVPRSYETASP